MSGSPSLSLASSDMKKVVTVFVWVAISGALTAILEYATKVDFGVYTPVVMGVLNVLGVTVKQFATDTSK